MPDREHEATSRGPSQEETTTSRVAVVVASVGRPDALSFVLPRWLGQSVPPQRIVLVVTKRDDAPSRESIERETGRLAPGAEVKVVVAEKGLPKQRNRGLEEVLPNSDVVAFFDDDYVPSKGVVSGIADAFARWPEVNGITGDLLADGIHGRGLNLEKAAALVDAFDEGRDAAARPSVLREGLVGLYGCNMAYRASAIGGARFDERLPLYAWQEDIDFAARVPGGRIKTDAFTGVHCGLKGGRETAGMRLGYSQIANPAYLVRKGSMPFRFAWRLASRNFAANHLKSFRAEPWIDRRARAAGNRLALRHLLRGKAEPEHILEL